MKRTRGKFWEEQSGDEVTGAPVDRRYMGDRTVCSPDNATNKAELMMQSLVRFHVPQGLSAVRCLVPEKVYVDRDAPPTVYEWLAKFYGGKWPVLPGEFREGNEARARRRDSSERWSIPEVKIHEAAEDTRNVLLLFGIVFKRVPATSLLDVGVTLLGCSHERDLFLFTEARFLPEGTREDASSRPEIISRLLVSSAQFSLEKVSVAEVMDRIYVDDDSFDDTDPRPTMYAEASQDPSDTEMEVDGDGTEGPDLVGETIGIESDAAAEKQRTPSPPPSLPIALPPPKPAEGPWAKCKEHWRKLCNGDTTRATGFGWYYLPTATDGLPLLADEGDFETIIIEGMERMLQRLSFLWRVDGWFSCPDKDPTTLFNSSMRFDSMRTFVSDRYTCEFIYLAMALRPDWVDRLARAEGLMAAAYFNWLPSPEQRLRFLRCNEAFARAFGRLSSRAYYAQLCGSITDYARGENRAAMAERIAAYAERGVRSRCGEWRRLLQVDDETGESEAINQLGSLGRLTDRLLPIIWNESEVLIENNPLDEDSDSEDEESTTSES